MSDTSSPRSGTSGISTADDLAAVLAARGVPAVERLLRLSLTTADAIDIRVALTELLDIALDLSGADAGSVGVLEADGSRTVLGERSAAGADAAAARHGDAPDELITPIVVRGATWGDLRVGDPDADAAVLARLASIGAALVANAALYDEARLAQRWIAASEEVNARLLSGDLAGGDISPVAGLVVDLADAAFVGLLGMPSERFTAQYGPLSYNSTALRDAAFQALPARVAQAADQGPDALARLERELPSQIGGFGPTMALPLGDAGAIDGVLLIARGAGSRRYTPAERQMAERFVRSVSIARALASVRSDRERLALVDERDRIARDLHDHVIQSLFAVGLSLQSVVGQSSGPMAARVSAQIDAIDATIRQIRQTIFELGTTPSTLAYSQKQRLNNVVRTTLEGEGIDSSLEFRGPVDTLMGSDIGDEVEAVVREALSNVVRHAQASRVDIAVIVTGEAVRVVVTDNGRGLGVVRRRSGLDNMTARAEARGGTLAIASRAPSGTTVDWMVPVP